MAGWDEVLDEINRALSKGQNPFDIVRRRYLKALSDLTGRNTIAYYSGWLQKDRAEGIEIVDEDMTGFMNAIKGMECHRGLDLILHTPGGFPEAAESIVKYLRSKFSTNIRVIVPHLAMSAGTMIACAGKEIVMGKHSSLGPIDPQFNGIPVYSLKREYEEAKEDLEKNPESIGYWRLLLEKYPPAFLYLALDAIDLSGILLKEWLGTGMFNANNPEDMKIINRIVNSLNEHESSKVHSRHFDISFCQGIGLNIIPLEDDPKLQNAVLSVHHSFIHTLSSTDAIKIIENHNGKAFIKGGL